MTPGSFVRRAFPAPGTVASGSRAGRGNLHPQLRLLTLLFAISGLLACGEPEVSEGGGVGTSLGSAVPVVRNSLGTGDGDGWILGPEFRVGAVEGEDAFAGVSDVAPRSAGGMWVLDGRSHTVSGYDEDGVRVVRFGGEGDGPGELRAARAVFEADSGRLAVGVPYPPALHWYRVDGEYLGSERLADMRDPQGNPLPPAFADWSVTTTGWRFVHQFGIPRPGGRSHVDHTILSLGADGLDRAARDTVIRWSLPATPSDPGAPLPMVPVTPKWAAGPDDLVWWSPGSPYEIRVLDAAGNPLRSITLDREAVEVDARIRASISEGLMRSARDQVGDVGLVESALSRARWPDRLPHLAGLWVSSPSGRVFAAAYTKTSFDHGAEMLLDVFEADGRHSGTLRLPPGFSPRRFSDGSVFGVATDDLGLQYAVRYSMVREEREEREK